MIGGTDKSKSVVRKTWIYIFLDNNNEYKRFASDLGHNKCAFVHTNRRAKSFYANSQRILKNEKFAAC